MVSVRVLGRSPPVAEQAYVAISALSTSALTSHGDRVYACLIGGRDTSDEDEAHTLFPR